jgi:hypothetical protein
MRIRNMGDQPYGANQRYGDINPVVGVNADLL